jgi:hypothetical protein
MNEEEKGFVIKDRRIFSEDGEEQDEAAKETATAGEETQAQETEDVADSEKFQETTQLPEINFATFIFSLNSSVLVHLGLIEDPATGKKEKNLPVAKQTIDILGMLEEKTRGNLSEDEDKLLKNILHDLRLMYVKEMK